jgi:lysophospholipase L1-like esterase
MNLRRLSEEENFMIKLFKTLYYSFLSLTFLCFNSYGGITPNLLISKGKTIKGSSTSNLSALVDGKFSGSGWSISANSWVAINVGNGHSKIFLCWDSPMQIWSDSVALPLAVGKTCWQDVKMPFEYQISTSDSSTTGLDGQWTEAVSIKNNVVAGRGHIIDFSGKSWVKMSIASGVGQLDEIGIFDASNGLQDSWIFIGTSISQMAFRSNIPAKGFSDIITDLHSAFTPALIRGGIGCILSSNFKDDILKYLSNAGNVHFWAIEMGTNDAWGGTNTNVAAYKANMQLVIDSCNAHNIQPVIARMIATNPNKTIDGKWQIHPDFLTAIDDLVSKNNLIAGPDFYNFFLANSTQLNNDGVHPSATGAASIQRLWAEKMDTLIYQKSSAISSFISGNLSFSHKFNALSQNKRIILRTTTAGTASIFSINGEILAQFDIPAAGSFPYKSIPGFYLARFASKSGAVETIPVLNR